jgi:hypothetical protein
MLGYYEVPSSLRHQSRSLIKRVSVTYKADEGSKLSSSIAPLLASDPMTHSCKVVSYSLLQSPSIFPHDLRSVTTMYTMADTSMSLGPIVGCL